MEKRGGMFERATRTDNRKLGITVCIILSILLVILIVLYFNIDDVEYVTADSTVEGEPDFSEVPVEVNEDQTTQDEIENTQLDV